MFVCGDVLSWVISRPGEILEIPREWLHYTWHSFSVHIIIPKMLHNPISFFALVAFLGNVEVAWIKETKHKRNTHKHHFLKGKKDNI